MKFLASAVTLLLLLGLAPVPSFHSRVAESLVMVSFDLPGEKDTERRCTGFQVGIASVLTAEHCANETVEMLIDGLPTYILEKNDSFALLATTPGYKPILQLGPRPKRGDEVWAWGFSYGEELMAYHRYVAGYNRGHLITDATFSSGQSGGPIVDLNGKVVGVIQAGNDVVGIACTVEEIKAFVK